MRIAYMSSRVPRRMKVVLLMSTRLGERPASSFSRKPRRRVHTRDAVSFFLVLSSFFDISLVQPSFPYVIRIRYKTFLVLKSGAALFMSRGVIRVGYSGVPCVYCESNSRIWGVNLSSVLEHSVLLFHLLDVLVKLLTSFSLKFDALKSFVKLKCTRDFEYEDTLMIKCISLFTGCSLIKLSL